MADKEKIARAEALEKEAAALRLEAEWGSDVAYQTANRLVDDWLRDPDMWATHGCPPEHKLHRMVRDIGATLIGQRDFYAGRHPDKVS